MFMWDGYWFDVLCVRCLAGGMFCEFDVLFVGRFLGGWFCEWDVPYVGVYFVRQMFMSEMFVSESCWARRYARDISCGTYCP